MSIELLDYGASIRSVRWHDREICCALNSLEAYERQTAYMGAVCGRFSNRIANSRFTLNGKTHNLYPNDPPHSLHGGRKGFARAVWNTEPIHGGTEHGGAGLRFYRYSPDGEDGYPGNLRVEVEYHLIENRHMEDQRIEDQQGAILVIYYRAKCDAPTPVNLTNHAYWNLEGEDRGHINNHTFTIAADKYVDVDSRRIPTGLLADADGHMDLRKAVSLSGRLGSGAELPEGFDHCYAVNADAPLLQHTEWGSDVLEKLDRKLVRCARNARCAARARVPESGHCMEIYTDYPGIQFYTGCFLNEKNGRNNRHYQPFSAFCLETQFFPDSPNQREFPNTILHPGELYEKITIHRFMAD